MSVHRFVKEYGEVLVCPFCQFPLSINRHPQFETMGQVGYNCFRCIVNGALAASGDKPHSRYNIAVMENVQIADKNYGQIIMSENFIMPIEDNRWYNVYNNLAKEQTNIVIVEPARPEHFYDGEKSCWIDLHR